MEYCANRLTLILVWRTSTPEPTRGDGIIWTHLKDVTRYTPLFASPGTFILQLDNLLETGLDGQYASTYTCASIDGLERETNDGDFQPLYRQRSSSLTTITHLRPRQISSSLYLLLRITLATTPRCRPRSRSVFCGSLGRYSELTDDACSSMSQCLRTQSRCLPSSTLLAMATRSSG